ncbi:MAG: hypothetical protein K2G30_07330, partial [Muribaculaceae bacterium]|nr:hypothetical protein [Muribaculaceae bacterium]
MQLDRLISIAISTIAITLQCHGITKNEALEVVKNLYQGYDCDYYHINDHATDVWTFFVDAEPLKGWEHDCYVVTIPKNAVNKALVDPQIQKLKMPPSLNMTPAEVINRYGDNAFDKPQIVDNTARNVANPVANRTYAVILSGGINKNANYERYWNDCSFIYQSLTKTYSIPNDNIFVLMADGTDPADDMRLYNGGYASSPLDLDGDGLND